jgi:hypothetical protein
VHARRAASVERAIACYFYLFRNICVVLCELTEGLTCPQAKTLIEAFLYHKIIDFLLYYCCALPPTKQLPPAALLPVH